MAASYLAAPRLSKEEEEREKASLTDQERLEALSDLFGSLPIPSEELSGTSVPPSVDTKEETPEEKVDEYLDELEKELAEALASTPGDGSDCALCGDDDDNDHSPPLSSVSTAAYRQAQGECPHVVNSRDHRLLFLRAESFDAKLAATRMLRYWTDRVTFFGGTDGGAFGPLTIKSGAFDRDTMELSIGYPRVSPERDRSGRALLVFNQSVFGRNKYDRRGMLRACWCTIHRALEDETVQKRGFVLIGLGYGQLDQLDRKLDVSIWRNIRDVLPVRIVASHFIYGNNSYTYSMIAPNIKFYFGRSARARLREYTSSECQTLEELARYGIAASSMPLEMGGGWVYKNDWFEEEAPKRQLT